MSDFLSYSLIGALMAVSMRPDARLILALALIYGAGYMVWALIWPW